MEGNMVDFATLKIEIATTGTAKATEDLKKIKTQANQTDKATESLIKTIDKFRNYLTLGFLGSGISQMIQMADKMKALSAQMRFITNSIEQYNRVNSELFDIAQRTRADLEATTTIYTRSARALRDYGYSQQRILTFTETLNKAMAVGGVGAQEQASALFQLSQALGSGRLQGDEFRTIAESAPIILDVVAQYLGKTRTEVKQLASDGKITSQVLFEAMTGASQRISQQFDQMPITFGQAMTQMRNAFMKFFDETLNNSGLMTGLAQGVSFLAKNFNVLGKSILYVVAAYSAYKATSFLLNINNTISGVSLLSTTFIRLSASVKGVTAAIMANPLGLIAGSLTIAAGALYEWYSNAQKAKEETLKYADTLNLTNEALRQMSAIELNVTRTKLEESIRAKQEEIKKLRAEYERLRRESQTPVSVTYDSFSGVPIEVRRSHQEMIDLSNKEKEKLLELTQAEENLSKAQEEHKKIIETLGSSLENDLNISLERLGLHISGVNPKLTEFSNQLLNAGTIASQQAVKIMALTDAILGVSGAIKTIDPKISDKAAKQIERLRLQNALLTAKTPTEKKNIQYKLNSLELEGQGYSKAELEALSAEMNKGSDIRIDREFAKTELKTTKHQEKLLEKWTNYYNNLEDASFDNITKMQREQERALEELIRYSSKGIVSHEQYEKAKTLITERYLKERQSLAEKYAPEIGAVRQHQEAMREIDFLRKNGDLSEAQATKAKAEAGFKKWQETADKSNPFNGMIDGLHSFGIEANDVMGNISQITQNAMGGMSNALTDFVLTGKADFRSLAQSIIRDITSMIIKMMIFNALKSAFGDTPFGKFMGWSGSGGGAVPESRWIGGLVGFDTGGFTGIGGKYEPMGIVHGGEYVMTKEATNRLGVDYLNYLNYGKKGSFASGGGVNLPTSNTNHSQAISNNVSISVTVQENRATSSKVEHNQASQQARELAALIENKVIDVITKQQRNGGLLARS